MKDIRYRIYTKLLVQNSAQIKPHGKRQTVEKDTGEVSLAGVFLRRRR